MKFLIVLTSFRTDSDKKIVDSFCRLPGCWNAIAIKSFYAIRSVPTGDESLIYAACTISGQEQWRKKLFVEYSICKLASNCPEGDRLHLPDGFKCQTCDAFFSQIFRFLINNLRTNFSDLNPPNTIFNRPHWQPAFDNLMWRRQVKKRVKTLTLLTDFGW